MTSGIRVVKSNPTDIDESNVQFTSELISPKVVMVGDGVLTTDANGKGSIDIVHNLPYSPVYLFYYHISEPTQLFFGDTLIHNQWCLVDNNSFCVDSASIKMTLWASDMTANTDYNYKYFIFVEPAKDD